MHRHFANRFATKLFKGAVVTTKPRRRRRGRGAAAIIKKNRVDGREKIISRWPRVASRVVREGVGSPTVPFSIYIYIYNTQEFSKF